MKKKLLSLFILFILGYGVSAQSQVASCNNGTVKVTPKWKAEPFNHQLFIENRGQFNSDVKTDGKILYQAVLGGVKAYFTTDGIVYKYDEITKKEEGDKDDNGKDEMPTVVYHYLNVHWVGANPDVTVDASQEKSDYYTYGMGKNSTIQANAFEKITYKNIYPGIDIEYSFPKGSKDVKYVVIVHPGADASLVKLKYSGQKDMTLDNEGNIKINTGWGEFMDHTPVSYYAEDHNAVASQYKLKDSEESFAVSNINSAKTLMIDPVTSNWTTNPGFTNTSGYDNAYDVDYDDNGNVYAYGGYDPFQVIKFNSAGVKQWTYTTAFAVETVYGDFCVDKVTGESYIGEGVDDITGAAVEKVNTNGSLMSTFSGSGGMLEIWRMVFSSCTRQMVIGGGGINTPIAQTAMLDTNMITFTPINTLNTAACCHDVDRMAMDPVTSTVYFSLCTPYLTATTKGTKDNALLSAPVPALAPFNWNKEPNADAFLEATSPAYVRASGYTNGMNGMAASPNWLYTYDSDSLKQVKKTTGVVNAKIKITNTVYGTNTDVLVSWGGLDADGCDNVYVGSKANLLIYNSSLVLQSTTALTNTVYDVVLGNNYSIVYTCGKGFVESLDISPSSAVTTTSEVDATCGLCNGQATATLTICNVAATGVTYLWTPGGQTTQTATGLCPGTYTITMNQGCGSVFTDTALIKAIPVPTLQTSETGELCNGGSTGTASVIVTGTSAPYTYLWNPGGQTNSTATGLSAGTYTITVKDANGCSVTATETVTQPPALTAAITANTGVLCNNGTTGTATVTAGGGTPAYTYAWTPTGGTNAIGTGMSAGTYTVTVKDANGCSQTATVTITQPPLLTAIANIITQATCGNSNGSASVTAGGGTPAYTYFWAPNGGTNATATGLSAGTYTVTVKDNNGCSQTATVTVTQLSGVTASITSFANVLCNGGATGSATVTAAGGNPAYTYAWTPTGGTNSTATGLTAGTYTITVNDANGCSGTATVTITQPPLLTAAISASTNVLCNGGATGSATVNAGGGTPAYTYAWMPSGGTNANATGLSAGTYTITVKDANGCSVTNTVTVTQPPLLTATISASTGVLCNNGNTGTATVTAGGGTPAYTYAWAPTGGTNAIGTGMSAGTYTVTVKDANGCVSTATVTITQPAAVTANITATTNVLCNGGNNGSATVTAGGGTPNYTYAWTPAGGTNATGTGLTAGTYTVTVTDANGCTQTATTTITQPPLLTATISASTNVLCNGGSTGSATVTAGGGTPNYTYAWTPSGGTNANATGLTAGTYTITISDNNGCTATNTVTITQPPALTAATSFTQASCNLSNGSVTVVVGGGTPNYTYVWTPGGKPNATATGLSANSYTVVVTDANGCTETATVTVTQPSAVTASITGSTGALCNGGSTGTATASAAGGTAPYTYSWNPGGNTNANATGLSAGSYTVTVKDANGCVSTATVTITQPAAVTANITATTNVLCNGGNNGSATVTAGGGTPNYTYAWTPAGGTNATGTGLTAGTYTVTVTDANGCTQTTTTTITQPPLLTATISASTNVLCNGGSTGSATVTAGGGTPNYTYAWTPSGGTNANATGLTAGTYTITISDNNGCTATNTVTITQPPALTAATSFTQASCNLSNGSVTVVVGGGTPNYTYVWTPGGNTNATATGLSANSYTVVVTDANGCTETATVTVTQPSAVTASITGSTGALCNGGSTGTATASAAGGTAPYTYSWNPGGNTNANAAGLSAGSYTVTVKDANGCVSTATVTITQPAAVTANITATTNVLCNGGNNGSATVTAGGGTPNYTYAWTPAGGTNATGTGLTAGTYTVTVTDANGCTQTATTTITQPPLLTATISASTNVLCNGGSTGSATVTAGGGTPNYTYAWTPSGGTNANATGLTAGTYTATITDINGCSATASVAITEPPALIANITASANISCFGGTNGTATVTAGGGTPAYTYSWAPSGGTNAMETGMAAGNYSVTITDNNGCTATASVTITQPIVLAVNISGQTNVSCFGGNNGTAASVASGGTPNYAYVWTPVGGTNATGTGLGAGNYTITVTDANGCTVTNTVTITQPNLLSATTTIATNVSCNGGSNGSATANVVGGTGPYLYAWTPSGGTNATGTGMIAGIYTVTVTDANGCSATATATITQPTILTASIGAVNNVKCNGGNDGNATAAGVGGTLPYKYLWFPSSGTNALITGLTVGTYSVTITDANGCAATASVTITQPAILATSLTSTNVSCFGGNNGSATSTTTGGTIPYAYNWSNAQITANASNLTAGSYTLTVTDANGCVATASVTITEPTKLIVSALGPQSDCSGAPATLNSFASGGTGPYIYSWSPAGGTTSTTTTNPLSTTTYTVTVTDANGCIAKATVFVFVDAPLTLSVSGNTTVCPGGTINLIATGSGGDGNYSYIWLPGNITTQAVSFSPTKDTTVTVELTDGCGSGMASLTIPILVDPLPKISFSSDIYTGCVPLCIQLRNMTTIPSGGIYGYGWNFGNGDSSREIDPLYCYKDTGIYSISLTATTDSGCSSTLKVINLITVYPPPAANFTYSPNPINILNPQVQFTDQSTGKYPISEWYWTFGGGDSSSLLQNPEHTYMDTGTFCVHLMVVDVHGCIDSVTNCLVVNPLFTFYIPDAFSPNGDGLNDVFVPKGTYIRKYEMYIYDRWGEQLFHSTDINNGWNGTVKGGSTISQEDTYVYLINVTDSEGEQHSYTGKVTLIK